MRHLSTYDIRLQAFWSKRKNQLILSVFFFFLAYPIITILFSFSLYLFLALLIKMRKSRILNVNITNYGSFFILLFGVSAIISTFFAPPSPRESDYNPVIVMIQYIYWAILAVILIKQAKHLNYYLLSKFITWGLVILSLNFFLFNDLLKLGFVSFYINRNTYTYVMLCFFPLSTWYISKKFSQKGLIIYLFSGLFLMLLTNGRSAGILIFIEIILLLQAYLPTIQKISKVVTIALLLVVGVSSFTIDASQARNSIGSLFDNISPRMSEFIRGTGDAGNLETDKSWLVRELMVRKGLEISQSYPFFGIGPLKFASYNAELTAAYSVEFRNLYIDHYGLQYYNKKSAHNSYIMVLAEQGFIGFIVFLLIVLPLIVNLLRKILISIVTENDIPLISMLAISLHFYAIASMPSAITWVVIGLSYARFHGNLQLK